MVRPTDRLARLESWRLALCLLALGLGSAFAVWQTVSAFARHKFVASFVGGLAVLVWLLLKVWRHRKILENDWISS
jgi:hypothetical protein